MLTNARKAGLGVIAAAVCGASGIDAQRSAPLPVNGVPVPIVVVSVREAGNEFVFDFSVCNVIEDGVYREVLTPRIPGGPDGLKSHGDEVEQEEWSRNGTTLTPACPSSGLQSPIGYSRKPLRALRPPPCAPSTTYTLEVDVQGPTTGLIPGRLVRATPRTFTVTPAGPCPAPSAPPTPSFETMPPGCPVCGGPGIPPNPVFGYENESQFWCNLKGPAGNNTGVCRQQSTCLPGWTKVNQDGKWVCRR